MQVSLSKSALICSAFCCLCSCRFYCGYQSESGNSPSVFTLQFLRKKRKRRRGKKFEIIEPSASRSLKTKTRCPRSVCNTHFIKVLSLNGTCVSIYSPFTPASENTVINALKSYYSKWWASLSALPSPGSSFFLSAMQIQLQKLLRHVPSISNACEL